MKKGQVYEGMIQKVEFPNKGIVQVDGEEKPVIVKNGIPGQKIRFCVNKLRKGKAEGRLLEVMEKSALETREPVCSIFPACCPDRWCVRTGPCWTRPRDVRGGRRFSVPLPEPWILPGICTVVSEESADCRRRWTCTWWMGLMRRVNGGISLPTTA
mgnify:CR=1 FL=1